MVYTFSGTVRCFINEDWELIERIINFKPLVEKEHQGLYGGRAFVDGMCKISSLDKICLTFMLPGKIQLTSDLLHQSHS